MLLLSRDRDADLCGDPMGLSCLPAICCERVREVGLRLSPPEGNFIDDGVVRPVIVADLPFGDP